MTGITCSVELEIDAKRRKERVLLLPIGRQSLRHQVALSRRAYVLHQYSVRLLAGTYEISLSLSLSRTFAE